MLILAMRCRSFSSLPRNTFRPKVPVSSSTTSTTSKVVFNRVKKPDGDLDTTIKPPAFIEGNLKAPKCSTNVEKGYTRRASLPPKRSWATDDEIEISERLKLLVSSGNVNDLFKSLDETPFSTTYIFNSMLQAKFDLGDKRREIELKKRILEIMRVRGVRPDAGSFTPMISLYGKVPSHVSSFSICAELKFFPASIVRTSGYDSRPL